jgi:hypothetical protein
MHSDFSALYDAIQPLAPEIRGSLFEGPRVHARGSPQIGSMDAPLVQFTGMTHIPAFESRSGDLGM